MRKLAKVFVGGVVGVFILISALGGTAAAGAPWARQPLSKNEVLDLLKSGVPPARVEGLVRQYGVAFELTPQAESQLRRAGAGESLLKAVRELASQSSTSHGNTTGNPVLIIQSTPAGAQVYVDDELVGTTSQEGRLKLSQLAAGEHHLRLSHAGYVDSIERLRLAAGDTTVIVTLETLKTAPQTPPGQPGVSTPRESGHSAATVGSARPPAPSRPPVDVDRYDLSGFPKHPTNFEEQQVLEDIKSATTPELKAGAHERLARYYEKKGDSRRAESESARAQYWRNPRN